MTGQWIRLDVKMMLVGWTSKLPAEQYAAWVKLLQAVKTVGIRGGRIQRSYFDDDQLSIWRMTRNAFESMISLARKNGAISTERDGMITITAWNTYQLDPTGADRVAKHRAKDVTVTPVGNGCNDDVTGRDVTLQDSTNKNYTAHFVRFWEAWPRHKRKKAKGKCAAKWKKDKLDAQADHIMAVVEAKKKYEWIGDSAKYIPAPLVFLNGTEYDCDVADISADAKPERTTAEILGIGPDE